MVHGSAYAGLPKRSPDLNCFEQNAIVVRLTQGMFPSRIKKDGSYAHFFCLPPYHEPLKADLFHAAQQRADVLCGD